MGLSFLPEDIRQAVGHLNYNFITEIRVRKGQPVIIGYKEEYYYLDKYGICENAAKAIVAGDLEPIIMSATDGSIYAFAEQMKRGFITCERGVRIGLAGEYVTQNGEITAVSNVTSLNIRVPHEVPGCAADICNALLCGGVKNILIFSKPGLGKTTRIRDIIRYLSQVKKLNVLVFDERNEISATDRFGRGYDLGERVDVIRSGNKLKAFENAVRAMRPDVIATDELYGEEDIKAVKYAVSCGIGVVASSHAGDEKELKNMPFDYFVRLNSLYGKPEIYDKNFNACRRCGADDLGGGVPFGG